MTFKVITSKLKGLDKQTAAEPAAVCAEEKSCIVYPERGKKSMAERERSEAFKEFFGGYGAAQRSEWTSEKGTAYIWKKVGAKL